MCVDFGHSYDREKTKIVFFKDRNHKKKHFRDAVSLDFFSTWNLLTNRSVVCFICNVVSFLSNVNDSLIVFKYVYV